MSRLITALCWLIGLLPFALLCFVFMLRGVVYTYYAYALNIWAALALFGFLVTILLNVYLLTSFRRIWRRWPLSLALLKGKAIVALLILAGCYAYVWVQLSERHAKSESVYGEVNRLHPLLSMAVSTVLIADKDLIITDVARVPGEYETMGLRANWRSLHFPRPDGYVYAVDVRTRNRSDFRNLLVKGYFYAMGFNAIRHTGNADHLHISLSPRDRLDVK